MKANRCALNNRKDDRAEIGIGTMIVFIAAVIVAAVAAAVLINTAGNLQRKASETGKETTQEVAANMFIRDILGDVHDTDTDKLERVMFYVSLAPGAEPVDLNNTVIRWLHGTNLTNMNATGAQCTNTQVDSLGDGFCIRSVFNAGDNNRFVMSEGDRVRIEIPLGNTATWDERVAVRETANVRILPEAGSPLAASFRAPATFGTDNYVGLL